MNFAAMAFHFRIAKQTIRVIVREVCEELWKVLQPQEMIPPTEDEWKEISKKFLLKTNFPNCLGAMDGKHIRLRCPQLSGSLYYNFKHFHSIVLFAVADAEYRFTAIDVGSYGKEGDSSILRSSVFGRKLFNKQLNLPNWRKLPNTSENEMPYVFLGDEAFGLHENILKPYPRRNLTTEKKIFNYRLSRARRYVECAFGILTNKWGVFQTPILVEPDFAIEITKAACVLHNFVRSRDGYNLEDTLSYVFASSENGNGNELNFDRSPSRKSAITVRNEFMAYFLSSNGECPWQYGMVQNN